MATLVKLQFIFTKSRVGVLIEGYLEGLHGSGWSPGVCLSVKIWNSRFDVVKGQ